MHRSAFPLIVSLAAVAAVIAGWLLFFAKPESVRYHATQRVANSSSAFDVSMGVRYTSGPISAEEYRASNRNGSSTASYRIVGTNGKVYTITTPPIESYTVPFFFERLVADGIWKITDRPPRGDRSVSYTVHVDQAVTNERGSRTVTFTDPHYWATTAGRQYEIHLDRNKPTPSLLQLSGSAIADKRYQAIVDEFRSFGTPGFRAKVAEVQAAVRAGK
ncbi:MAG: hypothetical protein JO233_05190 [Candidatus Eremiobacteraeota bacterium]|nr:hypothetical protein [Candidatus Eremiobacteraeota bacterium]